VERAIGVVQSLVELARMGESVDPADVSRLASEGPPTESPAEQAQKIVLPGLRRVINAPTPRQGAYLPTSATPHHLGGSGPAPPRRGAPLGPRRHRQDVSRRCQGGRGARAEAGAPDYPGQARGRSR